MRRSPFLLCFLLTVSLSHAAPPGANRERDAAALIEPFLRNSTATFARVELASYAAPRSPFHSSNPASFASLPAADSPALPLTASRWASTSDLTRAMSAGSQPIVSGSRAVLRRGIAYAPSEAPLAVKRAIWATNSICRRPYRFGGGHSSFNDSAYDCSGTVSYALHHAGELSAPMNSAGLAGFGSSGRGRWITVYAAPGRHVFAMVAGLRLDTTDFHRGGDVGPRWHTEPRSTSGYRARHSAGL